MFISAVDRHHAREKIITVFREIFNTILTLGTEFRSGGPDRAHSPGQILDPIIDNRYPIPSDLQQSDIICPAQNAGVRDWNGL
jgi:hypothetical protein